MNAFLDVSHSEVADAVKVVLGKRGARSAGPNGRTVRDIDFDLTLAVHVGLTVYGRPLQVVAYSTAVSWVAARRTEGSVQ